MSERIRTKENRIMTEIRDTSIKVSARVNFIGLQKERAF